MWFQKKAVTLHYQNKTTIKTMRKRKIINIIQQLTTLQNTCLEVCENKTTLRQVTLKSRGYTTTECNNVLNDTADQIGSIIYNLQKIFHTT